MGAVDVSVWTHVSSRHTHAHTNTRAFQALIKFHETYYSADIMKLAVIGREPLDTLQVGRCLCLCLCIGRTHICAPVSDVCVGAMLRVPFACGGGMPTPNSCIERPSINQPTSQHRHSPHPYAPQEWTTNLFGGVRTTGQPSHYTYPVEAFDAPRYVPPSLSHIHTRAHAKNPHIHPLPL